MGIKAKDLNDLHDTMLKDTPKFVTDYAEHLEEQIKDEKYPYGLPGNFGAPIGPPMTRWEKIKWRFFRKPLDYFQFMWDSIREAHREY